MTKNTTSMPEEIADFSNIYHAAKHFGVCRIDKVEYIYDSKEDKLVRIDVQEKRKEKERLEKLGKSK